jgi:DNA-binding protein YbaB
MSDETARPRGSGQLEAMFTMLADEQRKLAEFQRKMTEASTVTESPNKMVTATFDGRGELVSLKFNNTKFRSMAPNELATMLMETLRRGRAAAFGQIDEMAGGEVLPGVNFGDLAAGKLDMNEVVGTLMTSAIDLPSIAKAVKNEAGRADA